MKDRELRRLLAGSSHPLPELDAEIRLLTVRDTLRAIDRLDDMEARGVPHAAVYFIARVLSMAIYREHKRLFDGPEALMEELPVETLISLAETYSGLVKKISDPIRLENLKLALKNDKGERLRWRIMRKLKLSPSEAADMTDGDFVYCGLNLMLDGEETEGGFNPHFDEGRFEDGK